MTNKNKTVAELLNDVDADAVVRDGVLYYEQTIGRVFGPVLAELYEYIAAFNALLVQKDIENANLSRAVAELTETKADFYRSGVADGRAQKDAELAETREALRLAHDHMRLYLKHYHAGQNVFDTIHAVLEPDKKDAELRDLASCQVKIPHDLQQIVTNAQADMLRDNPLQELADESQPVGMSISDAMSKVLAGDVGPHRITPGAVQEAYAKAREAIKRDPIEPGSERHFHILMATHNLHAVVGRDYRNVMGLCADVWRSAATEQAEPSVNEELFVVAQQHPSRSEVSMFTANEKVAEEYKRNGWTVLKIQRAEAAKKDAGE